MNIKPLFTTPLYLVQDNDSHWYLLPEEELQSFEQWVVAMENCEDWDGMDYAAFYGIDGPHKIGILAYTIKE